MERLGDGANALQTAFNQTSEVAHLPGMRQGEAFKGSVVGAGQDPGLVGDAGGVGAEGDEISADFDDALTLLYLLGQHVAEHAAFLLLEIIKRRSQFVENAAGDEGGGGQLRVGMVELLPGSWAVILEYGDVAETAIAFQVLNSL